MILICYPIGGTGGQVPEGALRLLARANAARSSASAAQQVIEDERKANAAETER